MMDLATAWTRLDQNAEDPDALRVVAYAMPSVEDAAALLAQSLVLLLDAERWSDVVSVHYDLISLDPTTKLTREVVVPRLLGAGMLDVLSLVVDDVAAAMAASSSFDGLAWRCLATWRIRLSDYAGAVDAASRALALHPDDVASEHILASAYHHLGDQAAALAAARRSVALDATCVESCSLTAKLSAITGDHAAAFSFSCDWTRLAPDDAHAWAARARACAALGDRAGVTRALMTLSQKPEPTSQDLLWGMNALLSQGEAANADALARVLSQIDPIWSSYARPIPGDRPGDLAQLVRKITEAFEAPPPPPPGACAPRRPWGGRRVAFLIRLFGGEEAPFEGVVRQVASASVAAVPLFVHDTLKVGANLHCQEFINFSNDVRKNLPDVVLFDVDQFNYKSRLPDLACELRQEGVRVVGVSYDLWGDTGRDIIRNWGPSLDVIIGYTPNFAEEYASSNLVKVIMPPMKPEHPDASCWETRKIPWLFCGRLLGDRAGWLARALVAEPDPPPLLRLLGRDPAVHYNDYLANLRRARAVVNLSVRTTGEKIFTGRAAEAIAEGSLLLQQSGGYADYFFNENRHYLEFSCFDEMCLGLSFAKERPELAMKVAAEGREFFQKTYGPIAWWEMLSGAIA